jgi:exonuclease-1
MGVVELMKMAKSRATVGSIYTFAHGDVVGVDLSVWLYQLAPYIRIADGDEAFDKVAEIIAARARRFTRLGVTLVVVADSAHTSPAKEAERKKRRAARANSATEDAVPEVAGAPGLWDGEEISAEAAAPVIDVHGKLQEVVLRVLIAAGYQCIVAPAEADHQLAYMSATGELDGVITVDSDLLVLGVPVIYTGLKRDGTCERIVLADMWRPRLRPAPGPGDPLVWLCEAFARGGESLARSVLRLYGCIAHSDFNTIPQFTSCGRFMIISLTTN